jgi:formate/nitrite transporter FocA (FNT family)
MSDNRTQARPAPAVTEHAEEHEVRHASRLGARVIYEVIRRDGEEELARPWQSLVFSGFAAGMLIAFSLLGKAVFRVALPDEAWRPLIENFGYSFGFMIVILGRMQLFTENTITTVLPVATRFSLQGLGRVARLWSIVLLANLAGAFTAAAFLGLTEALTPDLAEAVLELSRHTAAVPASEAFFRGIPAGVLIAALVWMLPSGTGATFFIVLTFTWLIGAAELTHVVAGSVEIAYLVLVDGLSAGPAAVNVFVPVLLGNVIGGTVVFTLLAWGQVQKEVRETAQPRRS